MSVLELERLVDRSTLQKYLPQEASNTPALFVGGEKDAGAFSERDILYKVLFDLKKDVIDLKKLVHNLLRESSEGREMIQENANLFESNASERSMPDSKPAGLLISKAEREAETDYDLGYEDIIHAETLDEEEESFSLEEKEKEMIIKALKKNNNKRKYAAADLGISERTLYRKIKQYDIE
jgi:transcriptional regulator of acetoin/glycerol metabolism